MSSKSISVQALNIECPRCKAGLTFDCFNRQYGKMLTPHAERISSLQKVIEDSRNDWTVKKLLRDRKGEK
jgi:hypothetical protein